MQHVVSQGQSIAEVEALAASAAGGDMDAMGALFERYVDAIYRFVHAKTQDHSRTEEVVSEVWLRVVKSIEKYEYNPKGNGFPAWLFTIAGNATMDSFRSRTRRPETPTADMLLIDSPSIEVGPEEALVRREVSTQLALALSKLPAKQAQCVTLRFFDGLTLAETASVMATTVGSVKLTQHRALKSLAKILPNEMRILGASIGVSHVRIVDSEVAQRATEGSTR